MQDVVGFAVIPKIVYLAALPKREVTVSFVQAVIRDIVPHIAIR